MLRHVGARVSVEFVFAATPRSCALRYWLRICASANLLCLADDDPAARAGCMDTDAESVSEQDFDALLECLMLNLYIPSTTSHTIEPTQVPS